jgi:hypothetical protein
MKKIKKYNMTVQSESNSQRLTNIDRLLHSAYFDQTPMSEEKLKFMAESLILMAEEDPKMVSFAPWIERHQLSTGAIGYWRKKFPWFDLTYAQMKKRFTQRIVDKSIHKEFDGNFARFILPKRDKSFKKFEEWRNDLKKQVAEKGSSKIGLVEVPTFHETGKVPDKE